VVLLPSRYPSLVPDMREAILRHDLMHVTRRDWLFAIAEERGVPNLRVRGTNGPRPRANVSAPASEAKTDGSDAGGSNGGDFEDAVGFYAGCLGGDGGRCRFAADGRVSSVGRASGGCGRAELLSLLPFREGDEVGADPVAATVLLSCIIGTGGTAEDIHVVKSAGTGFDASAIDAVSRWQFKPGTR
jgi:TonB family protein